MKGGGKRRETLRCERYIDQLLLTHPQLEPTCSPGTGQSTVLSGIQSMWEAHQQMAARLLLFIKFGPSVNRRKSVSADEFLLGVNVK